MYFLRKFFPLGVYYSTKNAVWIEFHVRFSCYWWSYLILRVLWCKFNRFLLKKNRNLNNIFQFGCEIFFSISTFCVFGARLHSRKCYFILVVYIFFRHGRRCGHIIEKKKKKHEVFSRKMCDMCFSDVTLVLVWI